METERLRYLGPTELLDPMALPEPWRFVVWYWIFHHPDRQFLPERNGSEEYRLSWDDLHDVLVAAGVLNQQQMVH